MIICDAKLNFVLLLKKIFKKYNKFENKLTNNLFAKAYTLKEYNCCIVNNTDDINKFKAKNKELINKYKILDENAQNGISEGKVKGFCSCCNRNTTFIWRVLSSYSDHILFPETFVCQKCGMKNRIRAVIHLFKIFEKNNPKNKKIYCQEYFTQFFDYLNSNYSKNNVIIGSEYFGAGRISGEYVNGVLHEDCQNLSFKDNELDYIFSNDVFEHIPDINKALSEAKRCLKTGGKLIFRVPVELDREKTIKTAELKDGKINFLTKPEYHGGFSHDDPNGSLVYYIYGADIFEIIKNAGFSKTYGIAIQDEKFVNTGIDPLIVFICEK